MSEEIDGEIHIDEQDATGASKEGVVRWVLLVSLVAAILVLSIIWITGALVANENAEAANYPGAPAEGSDLPADAVEPAAEVPAE